VADPSSKNPSQSLDDVDLDAALELVERGDLGELTKVSASEPAPVEVPAAEAVPAPRSTPAPSRRAAGRRTRSPRNWHRITGAGSGYSHTRGFVGERAKTARIHLTRDQLAEVRDLANAHRGGTGGLDWQGINSARGGIGGGFELATGGPWRTIDAYKKLVQKRLRMVRNVYKLR